MSVRFVVLVLALCAASPCDAKDLGRYAMTTVGDGVWRLDSATGAISVCGRKLDHWACESVTDDSLALEQEVDRLTRENQDLKDKLAKAEEKEAEAAPLPANPSAQFPGFALNEMNDFIDKMIRRLQDLVRDLKQQGAGQEL